MKDDIFTIFVDLLNVKHTRTFTHKYYMEHPHKYNMYGLSSMLSNYGIENMGLHLSDKDCIRSIDVPFIAHTGDDFAIVKELKNEKVRYVRGGENLTVSFEEFKYICSGNVLLAEANTSSIEPNYKKHLIKEILTVFQRLFILSALAILLITSFFIKQNTSVNEILILIINLLGGYVGYLLVLKQLHIQSNYTDKLCTLFKDSDCNNILESDAAKLFGIFGWSELGFGYFISNLFIICFLPWLIPVVAIINILSLFFSLWSIWYQKFKAKQWCSLCLAVIILLWSMFILNLSFGSISFAMITFYDWVVAISLYSVFMFGTNLLVSLIGKALGEKELYYEINSLKGNERILSTLLKQQPHYNITKGLSSIMLGNLDSDIYVSILSNPHCNPCAHMHKRVNDLLSQNKHICVQYIFSSFSADLDISSKYLIAVYQQLGNSCAHKIYNEWFNGGSMNAEAFFKEHPADIYTADVLREFESHIKWKDKTGLRLTPTILLHGYRLPENYKIEDLKYITNLVVDI